VVGHGCTSVSKGGTDAEPESDGPEYDADRDSDQDADRRGARLVIHDKPDDHAADDRSDQEPPETDEIASPQLLLGTLVAHPAGSLSSRLRVRGAELPDRLVSQSLAT
jgi:hypothetical protein